MKIEERIVGSEKALARFGKWPDFHDWEVLSLKLERGVGAECGRTAVEVVVHGFDTSHDVDARRHVEWNHTLVALRFLDVEDVRFADFNDQNILFGLEIEWQAKEPEGRRFAVVFDSTHGIDLKLRCRAIECVSVTPCDREGQATSEARSPPNQD